MTSEGITKDDWSKIHDLALTITNAALADDAVLSESANAEMMDYLGKLKMKYGELPGLLATEADYTQDCTERLALLEKALNKAEAISDVKNQILITESLAEVCLEELRNREKATYWMEKLAFLVKDTISEIDVESLRSKLSPDINNKALDQNFSRDFDKG